MSLPHTRALRLLLSASTLVLVSCGGPKAQPGEEIRTRTHGITLEEAARAQWSPVVPLSIVPVAAANLPDGKVLMFSAEDRFSFGNAIGRTYTTIYDPASNTSTETLISNTEHNMFCPGTANLPDGRVLVNGGLSAGSTSIFNPVSGTWSKAAPMNIPRAYQGTTPLADGSVFTLGGSWAGGVGNKHGEVWTEASGWRALSGVRIEPFLSMDSTRNFGMDSHLWLLSAGNGRVFHAGPGMMMHWVETQGAGKVQPIGPRGDDEFSINGNTVMYDKGKVLKVGGAPGYEGMTSNANSYVIELSSDVRVRKIAPMAYGRSFHNSVVLPNGQVVVIGGATVGVGFSDNYSVMAPELFDPVSETFTALPPMAVPRNYHSVALLLPDGRVLSAGGGLCGNGCAANHPDLQILSPPYLFNPDSSPAVRPAITSAPDRAAHGTAISVTTDSEISSFAMVRSASVTHATNNDQRRLPLAFEKLSDGSYAVQIPSNPGWAVPGVYMLFAMNSSGVPSVAKTFLVGAPALLRLPSPGDQSTQLAKPVNLALSASSPAPVGPLRYFANRLPAGLTIDVNTGVISGVPTELGQKQVEVGASDGEQTVTTEFVWNVYEATLPRFVKFEARSEISGNPWTSAAEINLLGADGLPLPRGEFSVIADSQEVVGENGAATNALDGNPTTIWHTQWRDANPVHPHWVIIDMGAPRAVSGVSYLPRAGGTRNGTVASYAIYLSHDGVSFGDPVSQGDLRALGSATDEKVVFFDNLAKGKRASQSSTEAGAEAARAVDGNIDSTLANGSVTQTGLELAPFWEVDLGSIYDLFGVRLFNRGDCCAANLSNFYLFASRAPLAGKTLQELSGDPTVTAVRVSGVAPAAALYSVRTTARYVRVQLEGSGPLSLAEVEAYGRLAPNTPPSLGHSALPAVKVGDSSSVALVAGDLDGDVLTYSAAGLPPGFALDAALGVISGTATLAGNFFVTAEVTDGRGGTATTTFTWSVGEAPPVIETLAAPVAGAGMPVTYTAPATGGGMLEYQWSFGDGTPTTPFSGSRTVSHTFTQPGVYTVVLTVRNQDGTASSTIFLQGVQGPSFAVTARSSLNLAEAAGPEGNRIWAVNVDNHSVSVFDAPTMTKIREVPVGQDPRTLAIAPDGGVWVANRRDSTLSVVDPVSLTVSKTIALPRASKPFGVVIGQNGFVYVALEAAGRILKLSADGTVVSSADVGPNPRHLALLPTTGKLLVSRFITRPQPGESTANVLTQVNGVSHGGEVLVIDEATLAHTKTIVLQHSDKPDTTISGRGVPNYLAAPAVAPDGQSAWVPSKQDNIARGLLRDLLPLDFQNTVRAVSSKINLLFENEQYSARVDHDNAGLASAAAYHPTGVYLFVALETSRQVAIVDAHLGRELFRIEAGIAPQGVLVSQDGRRLYVHNAMSRTVGVYDLAPLIELGSSSIPNLATMASVEQEALSPEVLLGKQFFYDARDTRLSRDAYMSCASCHNDGGQDGRTWDFTQVGEGLRNTASLVGRRGAQGRLHWTGNFDEVQDFEGQIRNFAQGTGLMSDTDFLQGTRRQSLGDRKAGLSSDLDALAAYVSSLDKPDSSPYRSPTGEMTPEAVMGRAVFARECVQCHGGNDFTDSAALVFRDIGTLTSASGARMGQPLLGLDTPSLRGVFATAPYLHDGSAATLEDAIVRHNSVRLSLAELANVSAFVRELGGEEPQVQLARGLIGQYFANASLEGQVVVTRQEAVNFNWAKGSPDPALPADNFSARWSGQVLAPTSGAYRFQTNSDDGVRLWVNGNLVINNWTAHSPKLNTTSNISLLAGQRYDIRLEYQERTGGAVIQLRWRLPGQTSYAAIPTEQLLPCSCP